MYEWRREPLGNVAEIRPSNVDKKSNPAEQAVRLCNYLDVYTRDYIRDDVPFMEATATRAELQRFRVDLGDVLITKDSETPDDIGISAVVVDEIANLVCGYHLALVKPNRELVDSVYLAKQLASAETARYFSRLANGSTRYGLSYGSIAATPIRLAPPVQQRRISEVLVTVDEAIEQTQALISKTQQIKAGLMHDLFTRGLTPKGHLRPPREEAPKLYKESLRGWIPKEWDVEVFGSCVSVTDPNPSHRYPVEQEEGVPICSTESFVGDDDFDLSKSKLMPREVLVAQHQRCRFAIDDVVFARKGRIGLARRYGKEPKVFSHTVVLFKANKTSVDQGWLLWLSRSHWFLGDIARRMNSNSGVPTLGVGFINKVKSPFPQTDEQYAIGRLLDGFAMREKVEVTELQKLRHLKAGLMHDLLSGRVRVPLADAQKVAVSV